MAFNPLTKQSQTLPNWNQTVTARLTVMEYKYRQDCFFFLQLHDDPILVAKGSYFAIPTRFSSCVRTGETVQLTAQVGYRDLVTYQSARYAHVHVHAWSLTNSAGGRTIRRC